MLILRLFAVVYDVIQCDSECNA